MLRWVAPVVGLLGLAACSQGPALPPLAPDAVILAFGDSLTRGTGASAGQSYPAVLAALTGRTVVNEGVPGEESDAGLARLPGVLDAVEPDLVIIGHGGNDMLRKRDPDLTAENLRRMIALAREHGASVVLLGIVKPGLFLSTHPMYRKLAEDLEVPLEDGSLATILADPRLKSDAIHPNASGYRIMAEALREILEQSGAL